MVDGGRWTVPPVDDGRQAAGGGRMRHSTLAVLSATGRLSAPLSVRSVYLSEEPCLSSTDQIRGGRLIGSHRIPPSPPAPPPLTGVVCFRAHAAPIQPVRVGACGVELWMWEWHVDVDVQTCSCVSVGMEVMAM